MQPAAVRRGKGHGARAPLDVRQDDVEAPPRARPRPPAQAQAKVGSHPRAPDARAAEGGARHRPLRAELDARPDAHAPAQGLSHGAARDRGRRGGRRGGGEAGRRQGRVGHAPRPERQYAQERRRVRRARLRGALAHGPQRRGRLSAQGAQLSREGLRRRARACRAQGRPRPRGGGAQGQEEVGWEAGPRPG